MNDALWPLRTNVVSANAARPRGAGSATGENAGSSRSVVTAIGATSFSATPSRRTSTLVRLHSDSRRRPTQTREPFARLLYEMLWVYRATTSERPIVNIIGLLRPWSGRR